MRRILIALVVILLPLSTIAQIMGAVAITQLNQPKVNEYRLLKFVLQYNDTTFNGYLTSAPFSDTGTIPLASGTVSVATIASDGTGNDNAVAGGAYMFDSINGDRVMFHETVGSITSVFPADSLFQSARLYTIANSTQGIFYDPINQYRQNTSGGSILVRNLSGTLVDTWTAPNGNADNIGYYRYNIGDWFVAPEGSILPVQNWTRSASTVSSVALWYSGTDGITYSNVFDRIVNFDNTGTNCRIREQSESGLKEINLYEPPITTLTTEGIVEMPDGKWILVDPSGFNLHGSVTGGNRAWVVDPKFMHLKFDRSPSMTGFQLFSYPGGSRHGYFDTQYITQSVGGKIYSPVYDTQGHPFSENASSWTYEFSEGGDADIVWVGSNTAPTTTPKKAMDSKVFAYPGWGATTPGAEDDEPGTLRYKQAILTVKDVIESAVITVDDLISGLPNLEILIIADSTRQYVYRNSSTPDNQIPVLVNQKNGANNFSNNTASQRFSFNLIDGFIEDQNANQNEFISTSGLSSLVLDPRGQWTFVMNRVATNVASVLFDLGTTGGNNNRQIFRWNSTGISPASEICWENYGPAGTVTDRVGVAQTTLSPSQIDLINDGSVKSIRFNQANQSLNVTGNNDGTWYDDVSSPNRFRLGLANGLSPTMDLYFALYLDEPATGNLIGHVAKKFPLLTTEQDLIDAYIDQEF